MRRALLMLVLLCSVAGAQTDPLDPGRAPNPVRRAVFRAEAAFSKGDVEAAARLLTDALADGPERDHPALRYRLGSYLLELNRATEALPHLQTASEQAPDSAPVWADLGRAAYETGHHAESAVAFARAHATMAEPDPVLLYYSGVAWLLAEQFTEAVDVLAPLVAAVPDTVPREWVQALVSAAAEADQPDRAGNGVARLLRDHPEARRSWVLASQHSQLLSNAGDAALRLQVADWLRPLEPRDIKHLADLYGAAELPRQAARNYARLWPDNLTLARPLAVAWLQAHEPDSARVVLESALTAETDVALLVLLGDLEFEVERFDAARRAYTRATTVDAGSGRAWLMQGACGLKLNDPAGARIALERARALPQVAAEAGRLLDYLDSAAR